MMGKDTPIHMLIRFSDRIMSIEDTIAEHNAVIKRYGAVWFAKIGKPVGEKSIIRVNEQCRKGTTTDLLLVQKVNIKRRAQFVAHKGTVVEMATALPTSEKHLIPDYYDRQDVTKHATLWVKLSEIIPLRSEELGNYKIASSGMALPWTLHKSMSAVFILFEGKGLLPVA